MDEVTVLPQDGSDTHRLMFVLSGVTTLITLSSEAAAAMVLALQKQLLGENWSEDVDRYLPQLRVSSIRTAHGLEGPAVLVGTDEKGVLALIVPRELCDVGADAFRRVKELQEAISRAN